METARNSFQTIAKQSWNEREIVVKLSWNYKAVNFRTNVMLSINGGTFAEQFQNNYKAGVKHFDLSVAHQLQNNSEVVWEQLCKSD